MVDEIEPTHILFIGIFGFAKSKRCILSPKTEIHETVTIYGKKAFLWKLSWL